MPENPIQEAKFDHVGRNGELVFSLRGMLFGVTVDDTLEHAILEAKQLKAEKQRYQQTPPTSSLPISQIQSLIRAGAEPEQVAQRYGLSETLVRRFSSGVETEKQYAIEQFFMLPAPKDSRVHTISELIERTLAAAGIGMESVSWSATRRGLEPWKITARFESAGNRVSASWSWNMHDNAMVCLDATAKKLVGENRASDDGDEGPNFPISLNIPGDSVRSARIERAVSAWRAPQSDSATSSPARPAPAAASSAATPSAAAPSQDRGAASKPPLPSVSKPVPNPAAATRPHQQTTPVSALTPAHDTRTQQASASPASARRDTPTEHDVHHVDTATGQSRQSAVQNASDADATATRKLSGDTNPAQTAADQAHDAKTQRRAHGKGRKMPSWDEILFGD
ncbi:DNA binding protein [Bifidobacterium thermophilum]|uniref:DNA binding protein n=1 Tax=Bifidobacterium thermophilum TaxID=33905 RepID=A0A2N3QMB0_9BIFI|nr:septation protein SepH [Bifidobacterium thermophilum]PKU89863.1 DNA binding protein [Bifidobacterium thermophilum]PKU92827.1 DNA binding protein [Bifidobacterium thermophilum]